jgi:hypothetical protein
MIVRVDRHGPHLRELAQRDELIRRQQPAIGGDDEVPADAVWRIAEAPRIRQLAAEIQPAQEAEDFPDRRPLRRPQLHRQLKTRLGTIQQLGALAAAMRRGQEEQAMT